LLELMMNFRKSLIALSVMAATSMPVFAEQALMGKQRHSDFSAIANNGAFHDSISALTTERDQILADLGKHKKYIADLDDTFDMMGDQLDPGYKFKMDEEKLEAEQAIEQLTKQSNKLNVQIGDLQAKENLAKAVGDEYQLVVQTEGAYEDAYAEYLADLRAQERIDKAAEVYVRYMADLQAKEDLAKAVKNEHKQMVQAEGVYADAYVKYVADLQAKEDLAKAVEGEHKQVVQSEDAYADAYAKHVADLQAKEDLTKAIEGEHKQVVQSEDAYADAYAKHVADLQAKEDLAKAVEGEHKQVVQSEDTYADAYAKYVADGKAKEAWIKSISDADNEATAVEDAWVKYVADGKAKEDWIKSIADADNEATAVEDAWVKYVADGKAKEAWIKSISDVDNEATAVEDAWVKYVADGKAKEDWIKSIADADNEVTAVEDAWVQYVTDKKAKEDQAKAKKAELLAQEQQAKQKKLLAVKTSIASLPSPNVQAPLMMLSSAVLAGLDVSDPVAEAFARAGSNPTALAKLGEQLVPEINGGATLGAQAAQNLTGKAIHTRVSGLRSGMSSGDSPAETGLWIQALHSKVKQGERGGIAGFSANSQGFTIGADAKLNEQTTVGMAYSNLQTDVKSKGGNSTEVRGHAVTLYGGYEQDALFVDGSLTLGQNANESKRHIVGTEAKGNYDSQSFGANAMAGYGFDLGHNVLVEPRVAGRYNQVNIDGLREKGSSAALKTGGQRVESLELGAGVRLATSFELGKGSLEPEFTAMAYHDFAADSSKTTSAFVKGGAPFVTTGAKPASDSYEIGVGLNYHLGAMTVGGSYERTTKQDFGGDSFQAKVRYDF